MGLAYPFEKWCEDWAERVGEAARGQALPVVLPHQQVSANYLICNVCVDLRSRPIHLSEVTEPNWNVFYEAGFAFGSDKLVVLAEDANADVTRARRIFPEYLRAPYRGASEVVAHVLGAQLRPALNITQIVAAEDPRRIHFIDPGVLNDQAKELRKQLRRVRGYSYSASEGSIAHTPTLRTELLEIRGAGAVVGLLLPRNYIDSDITNARSCFLIGVAVALEKRVLVLVQEPAAPGPADLHLLAESFASTASIRPIVDAWLASIGEARIQEPIKRSDIRLLDLGNGAAERDPELANYFLATGHYLRAREASATVFLGRRGGGKSAIAVTLIQQYQKDRTMAFREVRPESFEMQELQDAYLQAAQASTGKHWKLVLGAIWRFLLLAQIARAYQDRYRDRAAHPSELDELESFLNIVPHEDDFVDSVLAVTEFVRAADVQVLRDFRAVLSRKAIYAPFERLTKEFPVRIVIDNLDVNWDTGHEESRFVLASLIREAEAINHRFKGKAAVLLFLRTDIYNIVKLADPDVDKQTREEIAWDVQSLIEVIGMRLTYLLGRDDVTPQQAWREVFPAVVEGQPCEDFIVARTLLRPRELIKLCMLVIASAQRRNAKRVTEADVLTGVEDYSDVLLTELHGEYLLELPNLYYFVLEFSNEDWPKSIDSMRGLIRSAGESERAAGRDHAWHADARNPDGLIRKLYDVGVLGLASPKQEGGAKREVRSVFSTHRDWAAAYASMRQQVSETYRKRGRRRVWLEPLVVLHPALESALGAFRSAPHRPYTKREVPRDSRGA
jgi:hypothetical protein